jgi:hypothetical protein
MDRYDDLKKALERAVNHANEVIERYKKKMESYTQKKYGTQAKKLRQQAQKKVNDLVDDRKAFNDRFEEVGTRQDTGDLRSEQLQYNAYDSDVRQTRSINVKSQQDNKATNEAEVQAALDQEKQRSSFFQRTADIATKTLQAFQGAGDIGEAFSGRLSPSGAPGGSGPTPTSAAAVAAASEGLSGTSAVQGGGSTAERPDQPAGGGPTIVINTLHPGDPATLDAIGQAATGGLSLQGSVISPRAPASI